MSIQIANHKIKIENQKSLSIEKAKNIGGELIPRYLIIHYTAGQSVDGAVSWLSSKQSKVSAHAVIGRDGSITQLVPFNRVAFHAGISCWNGLNGLNNHSIGLELDNAGRLKKVGNKWVAWFGRKYAEKDVLIATHKHDDVIYGWHTFTEPQITATLELALSLFSYYELFDVLGHDDIAPRRKWDPGPAFPMDSFRSKLIGRVQDRPQTFMTTRTLNIRSGPDYRTPLVLGNPLPERTRLEIISREGRWCFVDVLDEVEEDMDIQGWVHAHYLKDIN